jgi:hypothetical protein
MPSALWCLLVVLGIAALLAGAAGSAALSRTASSSASATVRVRVSFPRGGVGPSCRRVFAVYRTVGRPALRGAMAALLRGPTKVERANSCRGWFSQKAAGRLDDARVVDGVALVDSRNFRRVISNASSSCGSALLLAQLDRTAEQFSA